MRLRLALLLSLICSAAFAQVNPGTTPLSGAKGGTNNSFMQFSGPASSMKTYVLPNANSTLAALASIQTWTGAQSFSDGKLILLGSSSGSVTLHAPATGGVSATFFGGTDIVTGLAAVQTLTNKTINGAALAGILSGNPTFSGDPLFSGLATGTCTNSLLINSSNAMIIGACPGAAASIQNGVTTVTSGAGGIRILIDNSGTLGELATPLPSANGGTGVASPTANTIPINEGASAQTNIGLTPGQFVGGTSTAPVATPGPWTLLATLTASSSATLSDITHFTSAYNDYEIVLTNLVPGTTGVSAEIQVHSGGAFQTTGYLGIAIEGSTTNSPTTFIPVSLATDMTPGGMGISGVLTLIGLNVPTQVHGWVGATNYIVSGTTPRARAIGASWNSTTAIDGFQFLFSSGSIVSGTIKIYGRL